MDYFVFGSNEAGRHGKGAALTAKERYGAQDGKAFGPQGSAFAVPTKDRRLNSLPLIKILPYVRQLIHYAKTHPDDKFHTTPIGTGEAKFPKDMIAPLFVDYPENMIFTDSEFESLIPKMDFKRRLLIAGSKEDFSEPKMIFQIADNVSQLFPLKEMEIIPFTESFPGRLLSGWAKKNELPIRTFKVKWDRMDLPSMKPKESERGTFNALAMFDRNAHALACATDLLVIRDRIDRDSTSILNSAVGVPLQNQWVMTI